MINNLEFNIFSENIYSKWDLDEKYFIEVAVKILKIYLSNSDVYKKSCLFNQDFSTISFDILYCNNEKTHEINVEYRNKDYVADIITFAIFADSPECEKFIFDGEINLGEIIISLDKVQFEAITKGKTREEELIFLISHGILHLLGFDHQTQKDYDFVIGLQNEAISKLDLGV